MKSAAIFCGFVVIGFLHFTDAGKTIKVGSYDFKFGTWPLMEVSKAPPRFKHFRGPKNFPIAGPGPKPGPGGPTYGNYGPPPGPGKYVLWRPGASKGTIHKHLQETLKHYANTKAPVNLNLPIIVKAPGPNPPPPPPGYKLGAPSGSWQPGPGPIFPGDVPKSTRLMSMIQNAAYSGIFKNPVDTYTAPEFSPGPPLPGTIVTITPEGTEIRTHVNGDVIPGNRPVIEGIDSSGIELKPSVAPVLKLGEPIPENYTILYAERQIVGVKSPDMMEKSGLDDPGSSKYNAALNLGTKYEQGYGAPPPTKKPLLVQKFFKRGDVPLLKLVEQDLPDQGLISTTNIVFSTPNISAPLGGRSSKHFQDALADKQKILKLRRKEKPLDAQVKLLGRLFTKLQRLKPPKIAVPVEDEEKGAPYHGNNEPGGWNRDEEEEGWKKVAKTKVDSPILAVQIQTLSAPEVDSTDPDIVESMAEFGNHDIEFGETDEIVNLMDTVMRQGSTRMNIRDLGSNPQEINENLLNWARRHLTMARDANHQAHARGEKIANNQFKQYQTFVTPPFGSNGWGSGEPMPVDPKRGARSFSNSMTIMTAHMQGSEAAAPQVK